MLNRRNLFLKLHPFYLSLFVFGIIFSGEIYLIKIMGTIFELGQASEGQVLVFVI